MLRCPRGPNSIADIVFKLVLTMNMLRGHVANVKFFDVKMMSSRQFVSFAKRGLHDSYELVVHVATYFDT